MRNRKLRGRLDAVRQRQAIAAAVSQVVKVRARKARIDELEKTPTVGFYYQYGLLEGSEKALLAAELTSPYREEVQELCAKLPVHAGGGSIDIGKGTCGAPIPEGAVATVSVIRGGGPGRNLAFLDSRGEVMAAFEWAGNWRHWYAAEYILAKRRFSGTRSSRCRRRWKAIAV